MVKADVRIRYVLEYNHVKTLCMEKRKYVKKTQRNVAGAYGTGDDFFSVFWVIYNASSYCLLLFPSDMSTHIMGLYTCKDYQALSSPGGSAWESSQVTPITKKLGETARTARVVAGGDT